MEDRCDRMHECFSEAENPPKLVCFINPILITFSLYFLMPSFFLKLLVSPVLSTPESRQFQVMSMATVYLKGRGNSSRGEWEEGCCPHQTSCQPSITFPAQSGIETAVSVSYGFVSNSLYSPRLCNITIYIPKGQKAAYN